jgi:hypothetical protein
MAGCLFSVPAPITVILWLRSGFFMRGVVRIPGMDDDDFVWTFPVYFLVRNLVSDGTTKLTLDIETTEFYALVLDDQKHVVAFTDLDAAETFRDHNAPEAGFIALGFNPDQLLGLLGMMAKPQHLFVVDPNPRVDRYTLRPAQALVDEVHRQLNDGG